MTARPSSTAALAALFLGLGCGGAEPQDAAPPRPAGTVELSPAQQQTAGILVDTTRIERITLPLNVPGTVTTPDPLTAHVGSIVEGRVEKVDVLPGDRVPAGAALVHIHSHELATAARDLATAEAEAAYARAAYERSARLLAMEAVSQEEVDRRLSQVSVAEAELQRSRETLRHLSPSPDGQVVVRAPRGGTVFDVKVRPGEAVVVGTPLVDLGDASRLWVTGFLPENAVFGVSAGSLIAVTFDALPGTAVSGRVVRIGGMVDSLRRAVEVRVQLDSVPAGVRPGMFAAMLVPAAAPAERVVLPAEAVQRINGGDAVFLAEQPGSYRLRLVKATGLPDGRLAVEDLSAGMPVVVQGAYALKSQLESPAAGAE